jgi:hypothetical protein
VTELPGSLSRQRGWLVALCLGALASAVGARPAAQSHESVSAVPRNAADAIFDAFRTHAVVALGEGIGHGDEPAYEFRLALVRDQRFADAVSDVVVEFGNARFQDVIDRFVEGADTSEASLRHVWQDTTQPSILADSRIYQDFFRAVRAVNATRRPGRHTRVLLGDPPIDWEHVTSTAEFRQWLEQRDSFPAALIQREVLAKGHRALVVYGQMHFQRQNILSNYDMSSPAAQTLVSLTERNAQRSVFTIWPIPDLEKIQPDVESWPIPSIATIAGTRLGETDFAVYRPPNEPRLSMQEGRLVPVPRENWKPLRADHQLDAVMYEGPRSGITFAKTAPSLCADPAHVAVRLKRIALAGLPTPEADRLRNACER